MVRNSRPDRVVLTTCVLRYLHVLGSLWSHCSRADGSSTNASRRDPALSHVRLPRYAGAVHWNRWIGGNIRSYFRTSDIDNRTINSANRSARVLCLAALDSAKIGLLNWSSCDCARLISLVPVRPLLRR